jgi:hypothetical protein
MHVEIAGDKISRVTPARTTAFLSPLVIDSHVHLAYWPVADELAKAGIGGVVDLSAPERDLPLHAPFDVIASGPMLTRPDGYPLDSWGSDGYGIGCADTACIDATIARLVSKGTRVVKIALDDNGLDPSLVPHAIDVAHAAKLKVAVHALRDRSAMLAATAGADILAHTPIEPLRASTVAAWKGRAVISTLAAFGGSDAAIENLRALRAAGATILYGTDLGNLRDAGPSADEIALLARAGLDASAITDAMTTTPENFWGFPSGHIEAGAPASFIVTDGDPRLDSRVLLAPRQVWLRGSRIR